jgi:hypothetical protein
MKLPSALLALAAIAVLLLAPGARASTIIMAEAGTVQAELLPSSAV